MKKIILFLIALCVFFVPCLSHAQDGLLSHGITLEVYVEKNDNFKVGDAVFSLYDENGNFLAKDTFNVWATDKIYTVYFDVDFTSGDKFLLELTDGLKSFKSYDKEIPLYANTLIETYSYISDDGIPKVSDRFFINANTFDQKPCDIYVCGVKADVKGNIRIINDIILCEMHTILKYLHLNEENLTVSGDDVTISYKDKKVSAKVGTNEITYDGNNTFFVGADSVFSDGKTYLPLEPFFCHLAKEYKEITSDYATDIVIIPYYDAEKEEFIAKSNVCSDTDYLIWISKKDYRVNLFKGGNGNWRLIADYPCSIGAVNTPTVTGQFEYIEMQYKWQFDGYYVGPVMRFYNGYAIHSVLLRNNGTEYDGRVGMKLSHGCVRVKKDVIENLVKIIPFGTRIYITE